MESRYSWWFEQIAPPNEKCVFEYWVLRMIMTGTDVVLRDAHSGVGYGMNPCIEEHISRNGSIQFAQDQNTGYSTEDEILQLFDSIFYSGGDNFRPALEYHAPECGGRCNHWPGNPPPVVVEHHYEGISRREGWSCEVYSRDGIEVTKDLVSTAIARGWTLIEDTGVRWFRERYGDDAWGHWTLRLRDQCSWRPVTSAYQIKPCVTRVADGLADHARSILGYRLPKKLYVVLVGNVRGAKMDKLLAYCQQQYIAVLPKRDHQEVQEWLRRGEIPFQEHGWGTEIMELKEFYKKFPQAA